MVGSLEFRIIFYFILLKLYTTMEHPIVSQKITLMVFIQVIIL